MNAEEEANLLRARAQGQSLLDGTFVVPAKTCCRCGKRAIVKDGMLTMDNGPGFNTGNAFVPEITICTSVDGGCGHIAVRRVGGLGNFHWVYGSARVEIIDGPSYKKTQLPQPVTPKQRERIKAFLEETELLVA